MRVDLHVHSIFSPDSLSRPEAIVRWGLRRGLGALAVTDHNTIAGALAVRQLAPFRVIVGSEIATARGEVIGLFLQQEIAAGLSLQETIRQIHDQGGLAYVPHPLDRVRHSAMGLDALLDVIAEVDLIEAINARVTFALDNEQAGRLAARYHVASGAGSDAHHVAEIGRAGVEMPPFDDAADFLAALRQGQVYGDLSSPLVHLGSSQARLAKRLRALLAPERQHGRQAHPLNPGE